MAKVAKPRSNSSPNPLSDERDQTQRSLGCVSLSAIVHGGLLVAIVLAPSFRTQIGDMSGKDAGLEFVGEQAALAAPAEHASPADAQATPPTEVMLADASDPAAPALPQTATQAPATSTVKAPPSPQAHLPKVSSPPPSAVADALKTARAQAAKSKTQTSETAPLALETTNSSEVALPAKIEKAQNEPLPQDIAANDTGDENSSATFDQKSDDDEDDEDSNSTSQGSAVVKNEPPVSQPVARSEKTTEATKITESVETVQTAATSEADKTIAQPDASVAATGTAAPNSRGGGAGYAVPLGVPVRDARTLIAMPGNPKPSYPLADQIAGRQGTAVLVAKVKNDGSVENVTLEQSSGSPLMDESAAKAFKSWKYKPGQAGFVRLPVQFQLAGDAKTIPAQLKRR